MIGQIIMAALMGFLLVGIPVSIIIEGRKWQGIGIGLILIPLYIFCLSYFDFFPPVDFWIIAGIVLVLSMIGAVLAGAWFLLPLAGAGLAVVYFEITHQPLSIEHYIYIFLAGAIILILILIKTGVISFAEGGGGAGSEEEETTKHYKPGIMGMGETYTGKSIRRGDTIKHYDSNGRYRGESKVQKK